MYTKDTDQSAIDSVLCREMKMTGNAEVPSLEMTMVYLNSKTGITYGSCPLIHSPKEGKVGLLSPTTLEKLRAFIEAAEEDFGRLIFGSGMIREIGEETLEQEQEGQAGTNRPPRIGLGGGQI